MDSDAELETNQEAKEHPVYEESQQLCLPIKFLVLLLTFLNQINMVADELDPRTKFWRGHIMDLQD